LAKQKAPIYITHRYNRKTKSKSQRLIKYLGLQLTEYFEYDRPFKHFNKENFYQNTPTQNNT